MNFDILKKHYVAFGCTRLYIKHLSPNDNSKNQIYFGNSFEILNIFPFSEIKADNAGNWERARFKADINLNWLQPDGKLCHAPGTQLILYPKYPEVRLSGFLKQCEKSPSVLLKGRLEGRILILGIATAGKIIAYVSSSKEIITNEINSLINLEKSGLFDIIPLTIDKTDTKSTLLIELKRIHNKGWINSKRLNSNHEILPCNAPNCGGFTLEAELNITPNGFSNPDYLGWEIKQFNVKRFNLLQNSIITLMTPEPNGGFYHDKGVDSFIMKYGYKDKLGREDRMNFGGIHHCNEIHETTGLKMILDGYDIKSNKIKNPEGAIALIDKKDNIAASWSFSSLIKHWNCKHAKAAYIPSMCNKLEVRQYYYGNNILLGEGTSFLFFLFQMYKNNIYYDPGIKMEHLSGKHKIKRRSQFRIKSKYLSLLYDKEERIDLDKI